MSFLYWLVPLIIFVAIKAYQSYIFKATKPDFKGKYVIITGGSSGIGEELAK